MKKLIVALAAIAVGVAANAATVGWSLATGANTYGNYAYQFFVIGQNGADSIATITALLDAGTSTDSYAFGSGLTSATAGAGTVAAGASGKSLDAGTYTSFFVLFDSDAPTAGDKYVVVSGAANLTKTISPTTATVTFASGNANSIVSNPANWQTYGVPEPTSGLLLLLGVAGLALKRKRA